MAKTAELNINLIPYRKHNRAPQNLVWGFMVLALLLLLFAYFYISQHKITCAQQAENTVLTAAWESSQNQDKSYEPIQIMDQAMNVKSKEIEQITKNRLSYVEVINEIDSITLEPKTIMAGIEITPQRVILNGYSPSHSEISRLLDAIKASRGFADVALISSEMNETTGEVKFTLEIDREAPK